MDKNSVFIDESVWVNEKFDEYLKLLGSTKSDKLDHSQLRRIFITSVNDYKSNEINIDQFSNICSIIMQYMSNWDQFASDLGDVVLEGIDASCPFCSNGVANPLERTDRYYKRYSVLSLK